MAEPRVHRAGTDPLLKYRETRKGLNMTLPPTADPLTLPSGDPAGACSGAFPPPGALTLTISPVCWQQTPSSREVRCDRAGRAVRVPQAPFLTALANVSPGHWPQQNLPPRGVQDSSITTITSPTCTTARCLFASSGGTASRAQGAWGCAGMRTRPSRGPRARTRAALGAPT